jgi:hypothetical protein
LLKYTFRLANYLTLLWHFFNKQVPRLYDIYKCNKLVSNFQEILDNLFKPLFEVTKDPSSHPALHRFLQ